MKDNPSLREQIARERESKQPLSLEELTEAIEADRVQEAVENLIYFTPPQALPSRLEALRERLGVRISAAAETNQQRYLLFLSDLTLALSSFLIRWNLQNPLHGQDILTDAQIEAEVGKNLAQLEAWSAQAPTAAEALLAMWRKETEARLRAEGAETAGALAEELVGASLQAYVRDIGREIGRSNLRRIAEMRFAGQTLTELGNDYAAFLKYALYLGASFVTSNPVLVDIAWVADPDYWNPIADRLVTNHPDYTDTELARAMTLEVVLANMRLLRPIFLLTEGRMGCVSLQVNPKKHYDEQAMVSDALAIYEELRAKLDGGVPNVVFKLPGTLAGLKACRVLTGRGIGVNITVNFGLFQQLRFAQVIHEGQAIFACLTEMNGRLAYPVRDEMLAKVEAELKAKGFDEARAREAAAWSGVAVVKRLYKLLTEKGYDLTRIKPLVASLRNYRGKGYENLPNPFPDLTENVGASIITVFPDIRRAFDALPQVKLNPRRVEAPVPDDILQTLTHSEIFKQAYYVADTEWVPEEDERWRPEYELTLEDEEAVAAWPPVYDTLTQFSDGYDRFVQRIVGRKHLLTLRQKADEGAVLSATTRQALMGALTNVYDVTVREALQVICDQREDPGLALVLNEAKVQKAMEALGKKDKDIAALYRLALSKHAPDSPLRRAAERAI